MAEKTQLQIEVLFDDKGAIKGIKSVGDATKKVQQNTNAAGTGLQDFAKGAAITATAIAGIGYAFYKIVKPIADFKREIANVASVTGIARKELETLAREEARKTEFTASEAAKALFELGKAGLKTAGDMKNALGPSLRLATAGQLSLEEATSTIVSTLTPFNLGMDQAARVADVISVAANGAVTSVSELAEAMKYAAPFASSLGLSVEKTAGLMALFANNGIRGSMAGTELRRAMAVLVEPTSKMNSVLKKAGVNAEEVAKSLDDPVRLFKLLKPAVQSPQDAMRLFGIRGQTMAKIIRDDNGELEEFIKQLDGAAGAAERLEKERLNTLTGAFNILKSELEESRLAIADQISLSDGLQGAIEGTTEKIKSVNEQFVKTKGGASILNDALKLSGEYFKDLFNFISVPMAALKSFTSLIVNVAKDVLGIGESLDGANNKMSGFKKAMIGINVALSILKILFNGMAELVVSPFTSAKLAAEGAVLAYEGFKKSIIGTISILGNLKDAVTAVFDPRRSVAEELAKALETLKETSIDAGNDFLEAGKKLVLAANAPLKILLDLGKITLEEYKKIVSALDEMEDSTVEATKETEKNADAHGKVAEKIEEEVNIITRFKKAVSETRDEIKETNEKLGETGKKFEELGGFAGDVGKEIGGVTGNILSNVGDFFKALKAGVAGVAVFVIKQVATIIKAQKEYQAFLVDIHQKQAEASYERYKQDTERFIAEQEKKKAALLTGFDAETERLKESILANSEYGKILEKEKQDEIANFTDEERNKYYAKLAYEKQIEDLDEQRAEQRKKIEDRINRIILTAKKNLFESEKKIKVSELQIAMQKDIADLGVFGRSRKRSEIESLYSKLIGNVQSQVFPEYQFGGTVGGKGGVDSQLVRATPGETMLNPSQGKNLFNALEAAGLISQSSRSIAEAANVSNQYDNSRSVTIRGPITVVANNPADFARQMESLSKRTGTKFLKR